MKPLLAALAVLVLSVPSASAMDGPGDCISNFKAFDQAVSRSTLSLADIDNRPTGLPRIEKFQRRLKAGSCLTRPDDVARILARGLAPVPRPARGNAEIGPREVHMATVTDIFAALKLAALLRSQGYRVDTIPATGLGRRVYIRDLGSEEAVRDALVLARDMGLKSAYQGRMRGFFY